MVDININGITMEFDIIESKMDTELKAQLMASMPSSTEQELLDAYLLAHKEKYKEDFLQI